MDNSSKRLRALLLHVHGQMYWINGFHFTKWKIKLNIIWFTWHFVVVSSKTQSVQSLLMISSVSTFSRTPLLSWTAFRQLNFWNISWSKVTPQNRIQGFIESILALLPSVATTLVCIEEFPSKAWEGNLQDVLWS